MTHSAGSDVSLETSGICIVDGAGRIVRELKAKGDPDALGTALTGTGLAFARASLQAGPLSQWLHAGLRTANLPVVLHYSCSGWWTFLESFLWELGTAECRVSPTRTCWN